MADDGLTIDQRGLRTSGTRLRTYLPDELVARYEPLHNLNVAAGQADLVVARIRASGDEVVVKLYRNAEQLDREVETVFLMADPRHQAISSKLVKEIAMLGGDIGKFVSPAIKEALMALKIDQQQEKSDA